MKHSKVLFKHHLTVWQHLLLEAAQQPDAATALLAGNARTTLFYLEAITRLLNAVHEQKKMGKLNERFKLLEDSLGDMDHYAALIEAFASNPKIPAEVVAHLVLKLQKATAQTNALLVEQGWMGNKARRMARTKDAVKELDWLTDAGFKAKVHAYYQEQMVKTIEALQQPMTEIEAGVHELRRDVRWLSIYPQAFKGFFVLKPARMVAQKWQKYLTPEIVSSPFNRLTRVDDMTEVIELNQNNFYAMSWLIAALGTLKDQGLALLELSQAWAEVQMLVPAEAHQLALDALGAAQANEQELLSAANQIALQVKKDRLFEGLLVG